MNKIKLGYSPLSKKIYLYRHGKDPSCALEKRDAEKDVHAVLVESFMDGAEKGSIQDVRFGDQWYQIMVIKIDPPEEGK